MQSIQSDNTTFDHTQNWVTHEVQLYTLCTSQQSMKIHHFLGQGWSWHLANLLYNILRATYYFCLAKNIILFQLKILTFPTFCWIHTLFLGTPPCADVIASFGLTWVKTHNAYTRYLLGILLFLANQRKPLHLSFYLHAWKNTKDPLIIANMSKHPHR